MRSEGNCQRYTSLTNSTGIVGAVRQTTPLVALLRPLSKSRGQQSPEVGGIDIRKPIWVGKIGFDDLLRIDEEVLRRSRDSGILVAERGYENSRLAVVVELPVHRALWAYGGLVETDFGVDGQICEYALVAGVKVRLC